MTKQDHQDIQDSMPTVKLGHESVIGALKGAVVGLAKTAGNFPGHLEADILRKLAPLVADVAKEAAYSAIMKMAADAERR